MGMKTSPSRYRKPKKQAKAPRPQTTWTVPIAGDHAFELEADDQGAVWIGRPIISRGTTGALPPVRAATIRVARVTATEACQLGQALLDASRAAGAARRKAEDSKP